MASNKLVAIQWDNEQLLVATAQRAGGGLWIDRAEAVALDSSGEQTSIAEHLKRLGITRGEVTIVVPRSQVEMRQLDVPPVPESELPGLVRFQAQSQFASLSDDWALDYVPVSENGHVETVLATAMSDKAIEKLKSEVEPAGLKVKHVVIRPFSAVELVRSEQKAKQNCLIINHFETEIDLTVAANGYVNLSRSIRVTPPDDSCADQDCYSEKIIVQETRRTIAAAMNQSTSVQVDTIVICGARENHAELESLLKDQFDLPIKFFRPFEIVRVRPAAKRNLPQRDGRFTPLLGSLLQQDSKANHAVDFLNPRQVEKSTDTKRKLIIAGALAGVLLAMIGCWFFLTVQAKNSEIAQLEQENIQLVQGNEGFEELISEVQVVDKWTRQSVAWVEEMRLISERFLYPDEARTDLFNASIQQNKPQISLAGKTLDSIAKAKLVNALESRPYRVELLHESASLDDKQLKFDYRMNLRLSDRDDTLLVDRIREADSKLQHTSDDTSDSNPQAEQNDPDATNASNRNEQTEQVNHAG